MNEKLTDQPNDKTTLAPLSRRHVFAGAGAAGALAVVAAALPGSKPGAVVTSGAAPDAAADGYRLSEHVKRYYQTARV